MLAQLLKLLPGDSSVTLTALLKPLTAEFHTSEKGPILPVFASHPHQASAQASCSSTSVLQLTLIPDGGFILHLMGTGVSESFLLETDMGTVSSKRFRSRIRGYLVSTVEYPILVSCPDAARQALISKWAVEEAQSLQKDPTI